MLYKNVEVESWDPQAFVGNYVRIKGWWRDWEVPVGYWDELPQDLTEIGEKFLTNPVSEWWVMYSKVKVGK